MLGLSTCLITQAEWDLKQLQDNNIKLVFINFSF